MAPTGKAKAPAATTAGEDNGKMAFNQSCPHFDCLVKLMQTPGFDQAYGGAMKFYEHPSNVFWRDTYTRGSWSNGYYKAKAKANATTAGVAGAVAMEHDREFSSSRSFVFVVL